MRDHSIRTAIFVLDLNAVTFDLDLNITTFVLHLKVAAEAIPTQGISSVAVPIALVTVTVAIRLAALVTVAVVRQDTPRF